MKQDNLFTEKFLEGLEKWTESGPQEFFSWLFKNLGLAHRTVYLKHHPEDKGNGFYKRNLQIGALPIPLEVARTRYTKFRPFFLPPGHTSYLPEDYLQLAFSFLLGARSIESASRALQNLNLPLNQDYLNEVIEEFVTYLETLNSSPLPSDLAAVFLDGKSIRQKVKEGNEVREYTTYVALGLTLDGRKLILGLYTFEGQESKKSRYSALHRTSSAQRQNAQRQKTPLPRVLSNFQRLFPEYQKQPYL